MDRILNQGGQLIALSSQEPAEAARAKEQWGIRYPVIGDPKLVVPIELYKRGLLTLYVDVEKYTTGDMKGLRTYEKGMVEPGVVALMPDWTKLYGWACVPSAKNGGGAVGRVTAEDAWTAISASLSGDHSMVDWIPESVANSTEGFDSVFKQIFLRIVMLAEGNFARPMGLELGEKSNVATFDGHMAKKVAKNLMKVLLLVLLMLQLAHKFPGLASFCFCLHIVYYWQCCEPVFRASWHLAGGRDNNVLPRLANL